MLTENINKCQLPDVEKKTNIISIIISVVLLILAAALFVLSGQVESDIGSSAEIFIGVVAIGVALYMFLGQRKKLVNTTTGSVVSRDHIYYNVNDLHAIKVALANKSFNELNHVERQAEGNVQLVFFFSSDNKYIAIQVQQYEPFEYKPYSEVYVFRDAEAERLIEKLKAK